MPKTKKTNQHQEGIKRDGFERETASQAIRYKNSPTKDSKSMKYNNTE